VSAPRAARGVEAVAALIAVNVTPLAGILLLGWQPAGVLISYFVDTYVGACTVLLLLMMHVTGDELDTPVEGWRRRAKLAGALVFLGSLILLPTALPLLFVLGPDVVMHTLLEERGFRAGLAVQVLMSVLAAMRVHRELRQTGDDDRILSARGLFLVARWMVVFLAVAGASAAALGPRAAGLLVVAIYAAASVYFELFPAHAMHLVRGAGAGRMRYGKDLESRARDRGDVTRR
jgi:hypothetical protein